VLRQVCAPGRNRIGSPLSWSTEPGRPHATGSRSSCGATHAANVDPFADRQNRPGRTSTTRPRSNQHSRNACGPLLAALLMHVPVPARRRRPLHDRRPSARFARRRSAFRASRSAYASGCNRRYGRSRHRSEHNPPAPLELPAALRTLTDRLPRRATLRRSLRQHPFTVRGVVRPRPGPLPLRILRVLPTITKPVAAPRRAELRRRALPPRHLRAALRGHVSSPRIRQDRVEIDRVPRTRSVLYPGEGFLAAGVMRRSRLRKRGHVRPHSVARASMRSSSTVAASASPPIEGGRGTRSILGTSFPTHEDTLISRASSPT